jgi:hypothetical protein
MPATLAKKKTSRRLTSKLGAQNRKPGCETGSKIRNFYAGEVPYSRPRCARGKNQKHPRPVQASSGAISLGVKFHRLSSAWHSHRLGSESGNGIWRGRLERAYKSGI